MYKEKYEKYKNRRKKKGKKETFKKLSISGESWCKFHLSSQGSLWASLCVRAHSGDLSNGTCSTLLRLIEQQQVPVWVVVSPGYSEARLEPPNLC
eukprot:3034897-Amphidinium_carterae.1